MIDPSLWMATAIGAVLADRIFLDGRLGSRSGAETSTKLGRLIPSLATVPLFVIIGAVVSGLLSACVLVPFGAGYLAPPAFAITVLACALAGEAIFPSPVRAAHMNRAFTRASVLALLLGLPALPFYRQGSAAGFSVFALSGLGIAMSYAVMVVVYNGVREKIASGGEAKAPMPLSRDLCIASLLALVCIGILKTFY